jgi:hypothetical protein
MTDFSKIVFEIPTNKPEELSYIADIASESCFKFSVCLNGKEFSPTDEIKTSNLIAFHWPLKITEPCVSMMELRKAAAVTACEFHPDFRVISDGNCQYGKGWQEYVSDVADQLLEFERTTGETGFVGLHGALGGSEPGSTINKGRKIHVPINPMFGCGRGIVYRSWLWDGIEVLPSGFEDHYITSYLFRKLGVIPLKSFFAPIRHTPMHSTSNDKIHDRELWKIFNLKMVQQLWNSPSWSFPLKSRHFSPPRTSEQVMRDVRSRFMKTGYVFKTASDARQRAA